MNYVLLYVLKDNLCSYLLLRGRTQISLRCFFLEFLYKYKAMNTNIIINFLSKIYNLTYKTIIYPDHTYPFENMSFLGLEICYRLSHNLAGFVILD